MADANGAPPAKKARIGHSGDSAVSIACKANLHYSVEVPGKRVGRYIGSEDTGELKDEHELQECAIGNARELEPPATVDSRCFELRDHPTAVKNFKDDEEIKAVYYPEMEELIKASTGAETVIIFDHTVRDVGESKSLNPTMGAAGGAVVRVHTDYSDASGPKRVHTLATSGGYTGVKLSEEMAKDILAHDFCITNVWRNIKDDEAVQSKPLAVLDPASVDKEDFITYEMHFADRKGENYALKHNKKHEWYFYPLMEKDECLVFKTWESRTDRPRYCFHTAFDMMGAPEDAPSRRSIEIRSVAIMPKAK